MPQYRSKLRRGRMLRLKVSWVIALAVAGWAVAACRGRNDAVMGAALQLLRTDSLAGSTAADTGMVDAIVRTMAPDVVLASRAGISRGRESAHAALSSNPANQSSRITWAPIAGAPSGDGEQGFTYGHMTITRGDGTRHPAKYVAYWRRVGNRWLIQGLKIAGQESGGAAVRGPPLELPLPASAVPDLREIEEELRRTEAAFSDSAQHGFAQAFRHFAAPDAAHAGTPSDTAFRFGPEEIAAGMPTEPDSTSFTTWGSEGVIVASSGDLGMSFGYITSITGADTTRGPFLSIWRRRTLREPFRYIVE